VRCPRSIHVTVGAWSRPASRQPSWSTATNASIGAWSRASRRAPPGRAIDDTVTSKNAPWGRLPWSGPRTRLMKKVTSDNDRAAGDLARIREY